MPTTDPSEGFSGLQQWAEPVIFDRLFATYRKLLRDDALAGSRAASMREFGAR